MKRFFGRFFATIGALFTLLVLVPLFAGLFMKPKPFEINKDTILVMDLSKPFSETPNRDTLRAILQGPQPNFYQVIVAIQKATVDTNVKSIILIADNLTIGLAQLQEIRQALLSFRRAGKSIYAYATTFGDLSPGLVKYYFASVADKIWLQPFSGLNLTGLHVDQPFFGKLLDNLDVKRQIYARTSYKNAYSSITNSEASEEETEAMTHLLSEIYEIVASEIESARELSAGMISNIAQSSPMLSDEKTVQLGLIDDIKYRDEFIEMALDKKSSEQEPKQPFKNNFVSEQKQDTIFKNRHLVSLEKYALALKKKPNPNAAKIAVIYANGPIVSEANDASLLGDSLQLSAQDLEKQFDSALSDPETRAIVFRIDSPGGSAVASETIRRLVHLAKKRDIPVIASLGNYAASGGYWIASPCNKIYISPLTITGSIGALGGKLSFRDFLENYDVNISSFSAGNNGSLWSPLSAYNDNQDAFVSEVMDRLYARFVKIVSEGRNLTLDHVSEIAKGRVWSGRDALKYGLADEFGGLTDAIAGAANMIGVTELSRIQVVEYPKAKSLEDRLKGIFSGEISDLDAVIQEIRLLLTSVKLMMSSDIKLISPKM